LQVHISTNADDVVSAWTELEQGGIHTYFQTRAWCLSWLREVGPEIDARAVYVTGVHEDGRAAFLLPLQVRRKFGFLMLEFLTAPHASYGFGLFEKTFLEADAAAWFKLSFDALLAMLPRHDVVYLRDIPNMMVGFQNPLLPFARMKGANHAYMMALKTSFETMMTEKRSSETLKSMRKRDKRLSDFGTLKFHAPDDPNERKMILDRMFTDHQQRLAETGVRGVYGPIERGFLSGLANPDLYGKQALIPYTLSLNGEPICVLLGGKTCGVFWAMITSLADGPWRKHSPGDYTLRHVIAAQCEDGLPWFDFAVGDSDYKRAWADTKLEMNLMLQSSSAKGFVLGLGLILKHSIKRVVKRNTLLKDCTFRLRKFVFGRRA
jgi:CelD/BcsL family acetyltransferase involved in cellulose biosynthesis